MTITYVSIHRFNPPVNKYAEEISLIVEPSFHKLSDIPTSEQKYQVEFFRCRWIFKKDKNKNHVVRNFWEKMVRA